MKPKTVDAYLRDGCGRCELYQTPECKVRGWSEPLRALREILHATELVEEVKWGCPCYTLEGKNVLMISALKERCVLSFFKGAAIEDPDDLLERPGPNTRTARVVYLTSLQDVEDRQDAIRSLVRAAIDVGRSGVRVEAPDDPEPMPEELELRLRADPELLAAFEALTPGRQRSHLLHVGGAKQSATRARRAEACAAKIFAGKGFHER